MQNFLISLVSFLEYFGHFVFDLTGCAWGIWDKFDQIASLLQQIFNLGYVRKIVLPTLGWDG
jgi:hypothetical protein